MKQYLGKTVVQDFIDWMSKHLDDATFAHSYMNRHSKKPWVCESLYDAYVKYEWPHPGIPRLSVPSGSTYATNDAALTALKNDLINHLNSRNSTALCKAAIDVMSWGGVRAGNVVWLQNNEHNLITILKQTLTAIGSDDTTNPILQAPDLRFNAGMTKVYSLMCNDFVIYDSRVAAALGLAVVKFCRAKGLSVPPELQFPWAPAKEAPKARDPKNRNPSQGNYHFQRLQSGARHVEWNMKANWVLNGVIWGSPSSNFRKVPCGNPLRALEAALFMVGYDLKTVAHAGAIPTEADYVDIAPEVTSPLLADWIEGVTLGKGEKANDFKYQITDTGLRSKPNRKTPVIITLTYTQINQIVQYLLNNFGRDAFPLANNREKISNGTERLGLGTAYKIALPRGNSPDSSLLAAILVDVGIFNMSSSKGKGVHFTLDHAKLGDICAPINVRPLFSNFSAREDQ